MICGLCAPSLAEGSGIRVLFLVWLWLLLLWLLQKAAMLTGWKEKEGDVRPRGAGAELHCRCELMAGRLDDHVVVWPRILYLGCLGWDVWMESQCQRMPEAGCFCHRPIA